MACIGGSVGRKDKRANCNSPMLFSEQKGPIRHEHRQRSTWCRPARCCMQTLIINFSAPIKAARTLACPNVEPNGIKCACSRTATARPEHPLSAAACGEPASEFNARLCTARPARTPTGSGQVSSRPHEAIHCTTTRRRLQQPRAPMRTVGRPGACVCCKGKAGKVIGDKPGQGELK